MDDRKPPGHNPFQAVSEVFKDTHAYNAAPFVAFVILLFGFLIMKVYEKYKAGAKLGSEDGSSKQSNARPDYTVAVSKKYKEDRIKSEEYYRKYH